MCPIPPLQRGGSPCSPPSHGAGRGSGVFLAAGGVQHSPVGRVVQRGLRSSMGRAVKGGERSGAELSLPPAASCFPRRPPAAPGAARLERDSPGAGPGRAAPRRGRGPGGWHLPHPGGGRHRNGGLPGGMLGKAGRPPLWGSGAAGMGEHPYGGRDAASGKVPPRVRVMGG